MKNSAASLRNVRLFILILLAFVLSTNAIAAVFTVSNTNDSGPGSLRQAILDANAAVTNDTISFNIAGAGVHKIAPLTSLPNIGGFAGNALTIDGTTQPGWSAGNPVIELSGENLVGTSSNGLSFVSMTASPESFVRGLVINLFDGAGIYIQDSQRITIEGCFLGTDTTGTVARPNKFGVETAVGSGGTSNITIGGDTTAERNLISGNTSTGVSTFGGNSIFIKGNYIGTDSSGNLALGNSSGLSVRTQDCIIGGATTAERNVISGNRGRGITLDNSNNIIQNNYIGLGADGLSEVGNGSNGVAVINSLNLVIRGNHTISDNVIANNSGDGIAIFQHFNAIAGSRISDNSIYNNSNGFGAEELGLDLEDDAVTPNDAGDADTGANNLQNYPVLTSVSAISSNTAIQGSFDSQPGTSYRIEYYANDSSRSEGKTQIFVQNVTTNSSGFAAINITVPFASHHGQFVTATATRNVAPFDTSEFSIPVPVAVVPFVVTNTNDSGPGSLRQAIIDSNASADGNLITFAITPLDGSVKTISLLTPLPAITNPIAIDGVSQNGATCGTPKIELNGAAAGAGADGLTFAASDNLLQGLVINRFSGDGAIFDSSLRNTIRCNKLGTDPSGTTDLGNGASGLFLDTSHFNLIEKNTLSGNGASGLRGNFPQFNKIQGNIIGLSSNGTTAIPNTSGGILFSGGVGNKIGGTTVATRNTVSANGLGGIFLANTAGNTVQGNFVGVDVNGNGTTFGNSGPGVFLSLSFADDNIIGGTQTGAGNVIAYNTAEGVTFLGTAGTGNRILGNSIHDNGLIGIDLGDNGVTANDADDIDSGPNNLQNFPVLTNAEAFFGGLKVIGSLNSSPNSSYRIEVFSNAGCDGTNGEGRTFIGAFEVITDGAGDVNFNQNLSGTGVIVGESISATATRLTAPFDTSEFSACRTATSLTGVTTLTVTNTNDSGTGSLRQVITNANASADLNVISFNISGGGVKTITPATALPEITQPVIIDGLSQPGASCGTPMIELDGTATAGADGLRISGGADIRGLIINRFDDNGIEFFNKGNNSVKCSFIGISADGMSPSRNGGNGLFFDRVSHNTIGGSNNDGNVISSNTQLCGPGCFFDAGIKIDQSTDNVVQGNIIGLNKTGLVTTAFMNARQESGILLLNTDRTLVGGTTAAARNVISGGDNGVFLSNSDQNEIKGNYIGLDINGALTGFLGSTNGVGITLSFSDGNQIGGTETGAGNVISANSSGIRNTSGSDETVIEGNKIGTNAAGDSIPVGQSTGIFISTSSVLIGGTTTDARNIISGNNEGIIVTNSNNNLATQTVIQGNYIGVGVDGTTPLGAGIVAIWFEQAANGNVVGGGQTGAGNVISGPGTKIRLDSSNNLVQGNLIGTDATGTIDISSNFASGIEFLANATNNTIGGPSQSMRNIISGVRDGIRTAAGVTTANNNLIQNNFIGTAINGTSAIPNTQNGIFLESSNNTIAGNTIAFNTQKGVVIASTGTGNRISANSIHSNTDLGIDLGNDGVTANDAGDSDLANNQQNYPVISSATGSTITGTFNSAANSQFTIEFFLTPLADASNFGEGTTFLGSQTVTTDAGGNAVINFTAPFLLPGGQFVSATATRNTGGDTSEFSQVRQIFVPTAASVNIQGRVLTDTGAAISKAVVTITEPNGNVRTTLTNPFGYYRFTEVLAGETYVVSVKHKSFEFAPESFALTVNDEITNLEILGHRPENSGDVKEPDDPQIINVPTETRQDLRKP